MKTKIKQTQTKKSIAKNNIKKANQIKKDMAKNSLKKNIPVKKSQAKKDMAKNKPLKKSQIKKSMAKNSRKKTSPVKKNHTKKNTANKSIEKNSQAPASTDQIRLNKYLSQWGGLSRRKADELIERGDIFVNSSKVTVLGTIVDSKKDKVRIKKQLVQPYEFSPIYIMLNKPENVLTTTDDMLGRPTVMDYVVTRNQRIFPVGRLDWSSEGLLLLTNDGEFSQKVLHPKYKINKTYLVKIQGKAKSSQLEKLLRGVSTPNGKMHAQHVEILSRAGESNQWVKVIIAEGKNRQIRLMFEKLGYRITKLKRVSIGKLKLGKLKKGTCKLLKKSEADKVFFTAKEIPFANTYKPTVKTQRKVTIRNIRKSPKKKK